MMLSNIHSCVVCGAVLLLCVSTAFSWTLQRPSVSRHAVLSMASDASPQIAGDMYKSRALSYAKAAALLGAPLLTSKAANAKVFFDTDVYGDKELKIATVNKMKQKLRNAILEDNTVAPDLLKLAINDALGFVTTTEDGGPDGSVQFEVGEANNKDLAKAVNVVNKIKKELQRTNVVSFGDIVSFAGAEAVETIGGPRMQVQLGRFDAKGANKSPSTGGFIDWSNPTPEAIQSNFEKSGLGPREMALLLGALGEVNRVVAETKANTKVKDEDDEDDDGNGWQDAVPSTFGARDAMYGAKMGKGDFGTKYFKDLLAGKGAAKEPVGKILMQDEKVKEFVKKYASSEAALMKDMPEAYLKLTLLGQAYTGRNS